jgi:NTE family protein
MRSLARIPRRLRRALRLGLILIPPLVLFFGAADARGEEEGSSDGDTGLALSAGAARGLAHVGVLQVLEERGIEIDCIAGTSMGAVIGALYASGYSADEIAAIVRSVDWQQVFSDQPERPQVPLAQRIDHVPAIVRFGLDSGKLELPRAIESDYRINRLLIKLLTGPGLAAGGDFDRLPIRFRSVAADLRTGERVVAAQGSLARAVRASISIPVALPPMEDGNRTLVDGGVVDDLPTGVVRAMGAGQVIAVDVRLPPLPPDKYQDAIGVVRKLFEVLGRSREAPEDSSNFVITPPLGELSYEDYAQHERIIALGREGAERALEDAAARLPRGESRALAGAQASTRPHAAHSESLRIRELRIAGNHAVKEELIRETVRLHPGEGAVDMEAALEGMDALHATRLFDSIWLDVERAAAGGHVAGLGGSASGHVATLRVEESWRWTIEGGLSYNEADQVGGFGRLRNRNLWGFGESFDLTAAASDAELRLAAQLSGDRLLTPGIGYYSQAWLWRDQPRVFIAHEEMDRAEFDRAGIRAGLQKQFGPSLLLRGGGLAERTSTSEDSVAAIAVARERRFAFEGLAVWDRLDDLTFPTRGLAAALAARTCDVEDLDTGSESHFWQLTAGGRTAVATGGWGVLDLALFAAGSGGEVPISELPRVGGPLVPGLHRDELWDRQAAAGGIAYRMPVWRSLLLVARVGAGGAWDTIDDMSIETTHRGFGLAIESPTKLGPVSLMWGRGDVGEHRIYFSAGNRQYPPQPWRGFSFASWSP